MLEYKNDIIKNYVFNCLKYIEINQIECSSCKKILESIKDLPQYQLLLKCIIHKEVKIYTDALTNLFNKNFYSNFILPFSLQRKSDWKNIENFWNVPIFKDEDRAFFILVDIGNFKKINDNFSYKTGDHFLKTFGYFLIKEDVKFAIRNGGDEFILIIPSRRKTISLLRKFEDVSFIKNLNYNICKMHILLERQTQSIPLSNEHNIVYVGAGFQEINLNKIRKYIKTKNARAYEQYMNHIESKAARYMKKNKQKIKRNINIISYRD